MEFVNNVSKTKKAIFDRIKNFSIMIIVTLITIFVTLSFMFPLYENDNFWLLISFFATAILFTIGWFYLYINFKKQYLNFKIEFNNDYILEKSENIRLELDENCQITEDVNGNITIKNGKKEIIVTRYLNNKDEFKKTLSSNHTINQKKENYFSNTISWLSVGFFVLLLFSRFINILEIWIFIATGFVLTTVYATIYSIIRNRGFTFNLLFNIIINLVLIYFVSQNLFTVFKSIVERQ